MKYPIVFMSAIVAFFSLTVSATGNTTEEVCGVLPSNVTCCGTEGCMLFSCEDVNSTEAKNLTGCHLVDWKGVDICKENTTKPLCESPPMSTVKPNTTTKAPNSTSATTATPTPVGNCTAPDKDTCCKSVGCVFTNCTSKNETVTKPLEVCVTDPALVCKEETGNNQCAPTPTTTTTAPTDVCTDYSSTTDCCKHQDDQNCTYISCTGKDSNPHTGCHVKTDDMSKYCSDTPQPQCSVSPTPTKPSGGSTTQAPSSNGTTKSTDANANTGSEDHGQHFDGASFIGGIVLCAGIVAIAFFGLKFYRARTERNYHTL